MFNFEENALITIAPNFDVPACGATRFRWRMHAALPFMIPSHSCLNAEFSRDGFDLSAAFHNHFDRLILIPNNAKALPIVSLVQKLRDGESEQPAPTGCRVTREHLQSVAEFADKSEYPTPSEAFARGEKKIQACFAFLADHLASIQRMLPYSVSWTLYPVSLFDVGVVHHGVDHFCPSTNAWAYVGCGIALSAAKQLRAPIFFADLSTPQAVPDELDLANELLAEAQVALFRRTLRLAVLNSFTALETLANAVFKQTRKGQLVAWGVPDAQAEAVAENERRLHRTDEKFLLGGGMKDACKRSLLEEEKSLYDEIIRLEGEVRHRVAHRGEKPSVTDARACFKACCECVRWLSDVAGFPKKPMLPAPENSAPGFSAGSTEPYVCSALDMEVIRRMFGVVMTPPVGGPEQK